MLDWPRIERTAEAVGDLPAWFGLAGALAATVVAVVVLRTPGRPGPALLLAGCGVVGAGAALPDTEVVALVAAVLLATGAVGVVGRRPVPPPVGVAAALVAAVLVAVALWDGARGRPGVILLAPAVVAPATLAASSRSLPLLVARAVAATAIVVAVGRVAGLGDGTAAPGLGGVLGAATVLALGRVGGGRPPADTVP